jgi:hypothetical protein
MKGQLLCYSENINCHLWQLLLSEKSTWNLEYEQIEDLTLPSGRLHMKTNGEHRYTWNPSQEAGRKLSCASIKDKDKKRKKKQEALSDYWWWTCLFFLNICMQVCLHKKAASKLTARVFEDRWEESKLDSYLISTWFDLDAQSQKLPFNCTPGSNFKRPPR